MQAHTLAEPGMTVVQAQEQKFFASFFQKKGLSCLTYVSLKAGGKGDGALQKRLCETARRVYHTFAV